MTIGKKLILGFGALSVVVSLYALLAVKRIESRMQPVGQFHNPALHQIQTLEADTKGAVQESYAYLVSGDVREKEEFLEWAKTFDKESEKFIKIARLDDPKENEERVLFKRIRILQRGVVEQSSLLFQEYETKGSVGYDNFLAYEVAINELGSAIERLVRIERNEAEKGQQVALQVITEAEWFLYVLVILAVGTAIIIGYLMDRIIVRRINNIKVAAIAIGDGNFDTLVDIEKQDELGVLANALNKMAESLRDKFLKEQELVTVIEANNKMKREITERNLAEQALRDSEIKYQDLYDNSPDLSVSVDSQTGKILNCNQRVVSTLGYNKEEIVGRPIFDMYHPSSLEEAREAFHLFTSTGEVCGKELQLQRKNGSTIDVELNVSSVRDAQGRILQSRSVWRDITERKQAELALQESERFTHSTMDALSAHICVLNAEGTILSVNESWKKFGLGNGLLSKEFNVGDNYLTVCELATGECSEEALIVANGIRSVIHGTQKEFSCIYPCHSPTEQRWFAVKVTSFEGQGAIRLVVAHENMTDIKVAEEALKASEEQYRTLIEHSPYCIYQLNRQGCFTSINRAGLQMLCLKEEREVVGKRYLDLVGEKDQVKIEELFNLALQGTSVEFEFEALDGRQFQSSFVPIKIPSGNVNSVMGLTREITDQKRTEEAFHNLVQGTAGVTGEAFFDAFIKHLALALRVQSAVVTELVGDHGSRLRSLAYWHKALENHSFEYDIVGTPCETVLSEGIAYYPDRVHELFPNDEYLQHINAESYLGLALVGNSGQYIGHVCVIHDARLENYERTKTIMAIFGARAATELERMKAEDNAKQALSQARELARQLVTAEEIERKRIARELHDDFGQILTGLKFELAQLNKQLRQDRSSQSGVGVYNQLNSMGHTVDTAIYTMRRIATDLRPSLLDDLGLVAALEWQVRDFQTRTSIACTLTVSTDVNTLDIDSERTLALFRITQELLTNVLKHASASNVDIVLTHEAGILALDVTDDGQGITREATEKTVSMGLLGIKERLSTFNGQFTIQGQPGRGTRVAIRIPMTPTPTHLSGGNL